MTTNHIQFFLNAEYKDVEIPSNTSALEFIRNDAGLTGTKLGCGEGDCGTCTIAMGQIEEGEMHYKAVNSCLVPAAKMHHKHIVTVEGIADGKQLHPIQTAILENHATQCGFCTPGITLSLFSYFAENKNPDNEGLRLALEGNLCRCTGYRSIKDAADWSMEQFAGNHFVYPKYFKAVWQKLAQIVSEVKDTSNNDAYFIPHTEKAFFDYCEKHPDVRKIAGGTDLMVLRNLRNVVYPQLVDLSEIEELQFIHVNNNKLVIGANATLTDLLESQLIAAHFPVLHQAVTLMASRQIRNLATLSGNIANASPVADSAPVLLVANARLHLASAKKRRKLLLKDFYLGYKKTAMANNEIIEAIEIPLHPALRFSFEKSSKRKAVDISTVNSALSIQVKDKMIQSVNIAYGGIAPTPVQLETVEQYLTGKLLTEENILQAASFASAHVKPITDMRGSESYRKILVKNHLIKHFHKLFPEII